MLNYQTLERYNILNISISVITIIIFVNERHANTEQCNVSGYKIKDIIIYHIFMTFRLFFSSSIYLFISFYHKRIIRRNRHFSTGISRLKRRTARRHTGLQDGGYCKRSRPACEISREILSKPYRD